MMSPSLLRPPADFRLDPDGVRAPETGDVYFSLEDGLSESRAVFLEGCGLPRRWAGRRAFTVGELGFGSGLNIAALIDLWRDTRPAGGWLHVVSVEGRPLSQDQARAALSRWPALSETAGRLVAVWPPRWAGVHRRRFDDWGVTLTLVHEDAEAALQEADFAADAWFLDGFAPSRNPAMWSEAVFRHVARLSAPGALAATFTVAGAVRRGLQGAGFTVEKKPGFGRKRERLEAVYTGVPAIETRTPHPRMAPRDGRVAVIGGGIAAASLAHALNARGREVVLVAQGGWAAGASGAPSGLLTPRLEAADRPHVRATLSAFAHARALYARLGLIEPEGVLRLAGDEAAAGRLSRIATLLGEGFEMLSPAEAQRRTGVPDAPGGLFMAMAGRFDPARIVRALGAGTDIVDASAADIAPSASGWRVLGEGGGVLLEAPTLILAGGAAARRLSGSLGLDVETAAGRVMIADAGKLRAPSAGLSWGGYLGAAPGGGVLLGATHEKGGDPGDPRAAEQRLRGALAAVAPGAAARLGAARAHWGGVRAALNDRLPVCGPAMSAAFDARWAQYARGGAAPAGSASEDVRAGLAVLTGFGARGFAHAPLLAEALASDLLGEPCALGASGREALHPSRFRLRALRRG